MSEEDSTAIHASVLDRIKTWGEALLFAAGSSVLSVASTYLAGINPNLVPIGAAVAFVAVLGILVWWMSAKPKAKTTIRGLVYVLFAAWLLALVFGRGGYKDRYQAYADTTGLYHRLRDSLATRPIPNTNTIRPEEAAVKFPKQLTSTEIADSIDDWIAEGKEVQARITGAKPGTSTPPYGKRVSAVQRWVKRVHDWTKQIHKNRFTVEWDDMDFRYPYTSTGDTLYSGDQESAVSNRLALLDEWKRGLP